MDEIGALYDALRAPPSSLTPRTARLVSGSRLKKAKKVGEEAVEVALEAVCGRRVGTVQESADLIYNLVVLWDEMDISPDDVWKEMSRRRADLGIAEKLPKASAKPRRKEKKAAKRPSGQSLDA
jgi:phosphoribosyl-ATP pyrophosphohydrolase